MRIGDLDGDGKSNGEEYSEGTDPTDADDYLSDIAGDVNANGRISGIAQYRGMYGDRVAVTIDGIGVIGGGPNAMDTPLSYVSPMITEDLVLEQPRAGGNDRALRP